jgi:hypothetical protein
MVSLKVFHSVQQELRRIELAHDVRVLYACESGSRAWGFASHDSDYDVRFIYVHSRDWYLSIEDRRDVIEEPISDVLDISGWELRKTLRLLRKSNPPLLEWLKSPVVYAVDEPFVADFRQLADDFYSPARCFQHYLHMAFGNAREYLKHDWCGRRSTSTCCVRSSPAGGSSATWARCRCVSTSWSRAWCVTATSAPRSRTCSPASAVATSLRAARRMRCSAPISTRNSRCSATPSRWTSPCPIRRR